MLAAIVILGTTVAVSAESTMSGHSMADKAIFAGMKTGPDHGMPLNKAGGDGMTYTGKPDLQATISLVVAGGAPGHFSITKALAALAGKKIADAEVAKLTKQYGKTRVASYVAVQNYAVNDAVKKITAAHVKLPKPMLTGGTLADANYHLISNQAHYDLAQALGVKTVKLAKYH